MKYLYVKDFRRRQLFSRREKVCMVGKVYLNDVLLIKSSHFRFGRLKFFQKTISSFRYSSLSRIRNRCIFSGKSRAVLNKHGASRIRMREFLRYPIVYGLKKASW